MISKEESETDRLVSIIESGKADEHEWTEQELNHRAPAPGKFEGETLLAVLLYQYAMISAASEEGGDAESVGYYWKFDGFEIPGLKSPVYAILSTDSPGFVYLDEFTNHKELEEAWKPVEKDLERYYGGMD